MLTLRRKNKSSAAIMREGKAIGHVGMMAGGSCCFVNAAFTFGERFAFVSHATELEGGLADLVKLLTSEGLL
jgi:hypothetical protein